MTRKNLLLIATAIVLGGVSLYLNKDWFGKDSIQIYHRSRPARTFLGLGRRKPVDNSQVNPVVFGFDRNLRLTSIKVVPLSAVETNKYPQPIWHLVSDSNSIPTKSFFYGSPIRGMRPAVKGAAPELLEPGVPYRLLVEAGQVKLEHDFVPVPKPR